MFFLPYVLICTLHGLGIAWVAYFAQQPPMTVFSACIAVGLSCSVMLLIASAAQLKGIITKFMGAGVVGVLIGLLSASWICRIRTGRF